jgi:hypothetical protein
MLTTNYKISERHGERINARGRLIGGFILAIENKLSSNVRVAEITNELCVIRIEQNISKIFICFAYLSPNSKTSIDNVISKLRHHNENCLIIGDLNARIGCFQINQ